MLQTWHDSALAHIKHVLINPWTSQPHHHSGLHKPGLTTRLHGEDATNFAEDNPGMALPGTGQATMRMPPDFSPLLTLMQHPRRGETGS
jgi:hypothetical protein